MSWQDIQRITRSGFKNFYRSGVVSLSSIIVTTLTLSVITGLIFVQAILNHSLTQIEEKVDVTVYFVTNTSEENIFEVKNSLEKLPEVSSVSYTSSDEALASFRARHQNDYLTLQALEELSENPLGASLNIKAKDPSQYESIVKLLEGEDTGLATNLVSSIDKINYHQNKLVIDRLNSIINSARSLGFMATLVLVVISIIIMFNTIRLTIHFTREEIGIMRLVGAENKYIRGPFMIEGVIYGLVSTIATIIIFIPITLWLRKSMTSFLGIDLFDYFASNFFQIFAIVLVSGILLGSVSSFLAIRKYLRK